MKEFLRTVFATMMGILIMVVGGSFLLISFIVGLAALSSDEAEPVNDKSINVLKIELSGALSEVTENNPFAYILGDDKQPMTLVQLKKAILAAKDKKHIKGIYLECGEIEAEPAALEELREALLDFSSTKKFILAYANNYTQGAYYVASVADRVYLNPSGNIDWKGITAEPMFYKDLMDKVGIKMQIFRVGTFKSAVEPYMLSHISPANREMTQSMISSLWNTMCHDVSSTRDISVDSLRSYADRYMTFAPQRDYVTTHLVDSLIYVEQMRDELRRYLGEKNVKFASVKNMSASYKASKSANVIKVYNAEGEIVDAPQRGLNNSVIVGSQVVSDLDKIAHDESVKAVVLRINSPGGSAYASEQMWHALQLLKKKKPVVVSMGGMAASGGYYMSCGADFIVANPMTLTGSIGIFGMIPDFTDIAEHRLGVHTDQITTNSTAPMMNAFGGMSKSGANALQRNVERGYQLFLKRVAEGRGMRLAQVDSIAQGRVWTGQQALNIHLVDSLGNLQTAIDKAAELADLKDYTIELEERERGLLENLRNKVEGSFYEREMRAQLGALYEPWQFMQQLKHKNQLQARMPMFLNLQW